MYALLIRLLMRAMTAAGLIFMFLPFSYAQTSTDHPESWSRQESSLPGVKGGYHIVTTDPNRRDDRIGSSDSNDFKFGKWDVRMWGDISFGIGASSGNQKSGR